jgi:hypothetical protein
MPHELHCINHNGIPTLMQHNVDALPLRSIESRHVNVNLTIRSASFFDLRLCIDLGNFVEQY